MVGGIIFRTHIRQKGVQTALAVAWPGGDCRDPEAWARRRASDPLRTSSSAMAEKPCDALFSINVQLSSQNHKIALLSHIMGAPGVT